MSPFLINLDKQKKRLTYRKCCKLSAFRRFYFVLSIQIQVCTYRHDVGVSFAPTVSSSTATITRIYFFRRFSRSDLSVFSNVKCSKKCVNSRTSTTSPFAVPRQSPHVPSVGNYPPGAHVLAHIRWLSGTSHPLPELRNHSSRIQAFRVPSVL